MHAHAQLSRILGSFVRPNDIITKFPNDLYTRGKRHPNEFIHLPSCVASYGTLSMSLHQQSKRYSGALVLGQSYDEYSCRQRMLSRTKNHRHRVSKPLQNRLSRSSVVAFSRKDLWREVLSFREPERCSVCCMTGDDSKGERALRAPTHRAHPQNELHYSRIIGLYPASVLTLRPAHTKAHNFH